MDTSDSHADLLRAKKEYRWLKWATVIAMALGCATPLALNLVDPDLWGHVRYGQDWLEEGELPLTASHTFTAVDYPWINHENLAELALAFGAQHLGPHGMLLAKCLWGLSILFAMVWVARRNRVSLVAAWALMLLVSINLQAFFPLRPQLLSFGLCAITLLLLDRAFSDWNPEHDVNWRWLVMLPFVFAIWVNAHGGFVLGLCIAGAYLGGRILDLLWVPGDKKIARIAALSILGICCVSATLCNPYGLGMHQWLFNSLSAARPEITEWAAPKISDPVFWPWVSLIVVTSLSFWYSQLRRDWVQITILFIVGWQSAMHLRHIAFFTLLCGFWLPPHFQSAFQRLRPSNGIVPPAKPLTPIIRFGAVAALLAAIGLQSYALQDRLRDLPVERDHYPVDALQFMVDNDLHGKLVVCFNWAQYAIAALAPETRVGFDGRFRTCYPQEVIDMHFDFLLGKADGNRNRSSDSGLIDGTRVLEYESPNLVLLDIRHENAVAIMECEASKDSPTWVLLYRDGLAEIWGRSSIYDNPSHCNYFPIASRVMKGATPNGSIQWPALPERRDEPELVVEAPYSDAPGIEDDSI